MSRPFDQEWRKICLYLILTLVLGALLAPCLYLFGKEIVHQGWLDKSETAYLHGALDRAKFPRYFNRAILIAAVFGMIPLIRSLRFRGWKDLQIVPNRCASIDMIAGILLGAGFLLFMGAAFLYMRPSPFVTEAEPGWSFIPGIIVSALAVGFLEEYFFRGAMLGVCLRKMRVWSAVFVTSLIYAIVHFLKPDRHMELGNIEWRTGFKLLGSAFARLGEMQSFLAEFTTLLVVGVVLAVVRLRTRSLWLAIGLHAGWVFGLKLFGKLTDKSDALHEWSPWIGNDLKTGLIPLVVVFFTGAFASLWIDLSRKPVLSEQREDA